MSDKPVVFAPVETRIVDCERSIATLERVRELKSWELAALDFFILSKQTYLIKLRQEKSLNEVELKAGL